MTSKHQPAETKLWPKLLLMLSSVLFALLALETAYRAKLYLTVGDLPLGMATTYVVTSGSSSVPDNKLGYELRPNNRTVSLRVKNGQPVQFYERLTNELGNYGPPKPHYRDSDLRIMVFGDSFTAVGGHVVWPTLLEEKLQARLSQKTCVLNFGRDGYGILQMFDLANVKVPLFKPNHILFCFISDDLNRERLPNKRTQSEMPSSFLNASITKQWCKSVVRTRGIEDPLLAELNRTFERYKDNATPINYMTPACSFLYNRLKWDDPFHHLPGKTFNPRVSSSDFADDQQFVASLKTLNAAGIAYDLIHLPEHREMKAGQYRLTHQQSALLASLEKITNHTVINILDYGRGIDDLDKLFQVPHDPHPSAEGLRFYATAVDQALAGSAILGNERLQSDNEQR